MKKQTKTKKRVYHLSPEGRARLGRKPEYPVAHELARRFGVSKHHAIRVFKGERRSPILERAIPEIAKELGVAK